VVITAEFVCRKWSPPMILDVKFTCASLEDERGTAHVYAEFELFINTSWSSLEANGHFS
jgi:hypothetical protein